MVQANPEVMPGHILVRGRLSILAARGWLLESRRVTTDKASSRSVEFERPRVRGRPAPVHPGEENARRAWSACKEAVTEGVMQAAFAP